MLGLSVTKNSALLAVYALTTTLLIAGTFLVTKERIKDEKRLSQQRALFEIVPESNHDNNLLDDTLEIALEDLGLLGLQESAYVYIARLEDKAVTYIYPSIARDGYSGDIELIIGINTDGSVAGVRVLTHKETPGLGDKIDIKKHSWILDFENRSLSNPLPEAWKVKKDGGEFDQFTGATITPRAVVKRIRQTLAFHQKFVAKHTPVPGEDSAETRQVKQQ